MSLRDCTIKNEYRNQIDDVVQDFYIPLLKEAVSYKRAVGFFRSSSLLELTKGIAGLVRNGGKIYLIVSPYLDEADLRAIREGYEKRNAIIKKSLLKNLLEPQSYFEERRLNLLANLIAMGVLEMKIALLENEDGIGMYHEKLGLIMDSSDNTVAFAGSMNESSNAFYNNYESIDVFCSWTHDLERVLSKGAAFNAIWNNYEPHIKTVSFPDVEKEIISKYKINDMLELDLDERQYPLRDSVTKRQNELINIPEDVKLKDYQEKAIDEWVKQNFVGIYDMATGTGKTFTALGSLERLERKLKNIAVFIVCPYIHLVNQWEEDILDWSAMPIIAHSQSENNNWQQALMNAYKRFRSTGKSFICVTTNDTFRDEKIQKFIKNITNDMNCVLVVDEVHNFGSVKLSQILPANIKYRLGLSATVERYMDKIGTQKLIDYFGDKCIEYPIERAIREGALVKYEYHPIVVSLREDELEEYQKLTKQISRCIIKKQGKISISETGRQLRFKRSRLIAGAENKLELLRERLESYRNEKYILVYCGATRGFEKYPGEKERQIDRIEKIIGKDLMMATHRFTSEENAKIRKLLKEGFADGEYQVLTAIKCLDEGVNIPNIRTAFILASSRNPKEFIQRRGRVLRKAEGKDRAVIYDFVTLPRQLNDVRFGDFENDRAIIIGEMARIYEFGRHSINSREADDLLECIQETYCIDIAKDELNNMMEAEYGEE